MKEYYPKYEQQFARIWSKKAAWIVRAGIILGAIGAVCYSTYVVNNIPNWEWADFCKMPGFWLWTEGFLQIGVPYLFIRHIIRFFNLDIDDAYEQYRLEHTSFFDKYILSPKLWKLFHPLDRDYAMQYYTHRIFGSVNVALMTDREVARIKESDQEICHRIKVNSYRKICRRENRTFDYMDAERVIYAEEHPISVQRTQEASAQYQRRRS